MTTYPARPSSFTQLTTAYEWEKLFGASGIWDGIYPLDLVPSLDVSGRNIIIQSGTCVMKGQMWRCDAAISTPIPTNSSGLPRVDMLVMQYDRGASTAAGVVQPLIVTGTPAASNPQPPALVQNPSGTTGTGVWQMPVAQWSTAANGAVSALVDRRQFAGQSVIAMTSINRPVPLISRLGLEQDTGYLQLYDINSSAWRNVGPKNQTLTTGNKVSGLTEAPLHTPYSIPANDAVNATLGTCAYRIRCGGYGVQSTTVVATFVFMLDGFGADWGAISTGQIIPVKAAFNWHFDVELAINANGSGSLYGDITVSEAVANPGNAQSVYNVQKQIGVGGVNIGVATTIGAEAYVSTTSGAPSLTCIGSTYERISN